MDLKPLPGTAYSEYALPLEYMPSRDMAPRWGYSRPLIKGLAERFERQRLEFESFLDVMLGELESMRDVPLRFATENLPAPAWLEVPFSPFDGVALYSMVKHHRPKRFFEIGSGISTCFAHKAIKDAGLDTKLISVDPSPRAAIDAICDEVIRDGLETIVDLAPFASLEPGDILFLDGSHRAFLNSDVTVFFIDILPMIAPGVIVHIHDVTLPWDYPHMFVDWYWSEQYVLATWLMAAGDKVEVLLPTTWICRRLTNHAFFTQSTIDLGPGEAGQWTGGGSIWFRKKEAF